MIWMISHDDDHDARTTRWMRVRVMSRDLDRLVEDQVPDRTWIDQNGTVGGIGIDIALVLGRDRAMENRFARIVENMRILVCEVDSGTPTDERGDSYCIVVGVASVVVGVVARGTDSSRVDRGIAVVAMRRVVDQTIRARNQACRDAFLARGL